MENPAQFDLNSAIQRWRLKLQSSPALRAQDLDELEAHLRDSTLALQSKGLAAEEAFLIASERFGERQELECEFGKLNRRRVWMDRALWMTAGVLLFSFIARCAGFVSNTLVQLALSSSMNPHWIGLLSFTTNWILILSGVTIFWRVMTRGHERVTRAVRFCLRRPLLPALGMVALNYSYHPFMRWLLDLTVPASPRDISGKTPVLTAWAIGGYWIALFFWMTALVYLARRQWQMSPSVSAERPPRTVEDLEPRVRDLVAAVQTQGLSLKEAMLIAKRRLGHRHESALALGEDIQSLWIGRSLWMVSGVILLNFYLSDLFIVVEKSVEGLAHWLPPWGPILGLLAVCVQWGTVVALGAAFWKFVVRSEALRRRVAQFGLRRPVLSVITLLLGYVVFSSLLWLLAHIVSDAAGLATDTFAMIQVLSDHAYQFLHNAVAVVLLFWLARRQVRFQEVYG